MINSVAVFLGSAGPSEERLDFAYGLGKELAVRGFKVIFGGAEVGTMKAFADGVIDNGGDITGVFPKGFKGKREVAAVLENILMSRVTRIVEVKDMGERMTMMNKLSDCCIIIPGGYGTMEELFCYAVENEIGIHDKKAFVVNVDGYYDGLENQVATMKREGFLRADSDIITFFHSLDDLFAALK
ncbi:MAG: TIGR00730 family Rossman fold protein [Bacteroidia bacterium]|nr:TIGR00730 family Rossman fold protein [Bacteroidia bacterium]